MSNQVSNQFSTEGDSEPQIIQPEVADTESRSETVRATQTQPFDDQSMRQHYQSGLFSRIEIQKSVTGSPSLNIFRLMNGKSKHSTADQSSQTDSSFGGQTVNTSSLCYQFPFNGLILANTPPLFLLSYPNCVNGYSGPPLCSFSYNQSPHQIIQTTSIYNPLTNFSSYYCLLSITSPMEASFQQPLQKASLTETTVSIPSVQSLAQRPPSYDRTIGSYKIDQKPNMSTILQPKEKPTDLYLLQPTKHFGNEAATNEIFEPISVTYLQELKLDNLKGALIATFLTESLSPNLLSPLVPFERLCFEYLMCRKFAPKRLLAQEPAGGRPTGKESESQLQLLIDSMPLKRPEECYKFILTRVLKNLKYQFETDLEPNECAENRLYEHYFGQIALALKVPLEVFKYPLTRSSRGQLTLNSDYYGRLFKSSDFVKATFEYLNNALIAEYKREAVKKIDVLVGRWAEMLIAGQNGQTETQHLIIRQIAENRRCKLPWTIGEVKSAVKKFRSLMLRLMPVSLKLGQSDTDSQ